MPLVVWFVPFDVIFWSERYLQNHCPLAVNSGTKACKYAVGILFCMCESECWGNIMHTLSLLDAASLCYRDTLAI